MEFCGGGSLQEIYHGEIQTPWDMAFPNPNIGVGRYPSWLHLDSSSLLTGCVTLREILSSSGLSFPS